MYCPKCGQQASDNMRFCSRCGLPISEVAEWLSGGGGAVASREEAPQAALSPKRKGMRRGAKVMFWGAVLVPILLAVSIAVDSPVPLLMSFIVFLAGLALLLYSRLFGEDLPFYISKQPQDSRLGATASPGALPPVTDPGISISSSGRRLRTAEMTQPPSITDHTTKLLNNE